MASLSTEDLEALGRQIAVLRTARRYAEAAALTERYLQALVARHGAASLEVADALIALAELFISSGRSAEAEPLLQSALAIVAHRPGGKAALRELYPHLGSDSLIQSVPELRDLLGFIQAQEQSNPWERARVPSRAEPSPEDAIAKPVSGSASRSAPGGDEPAPLSQPAALDLPGVASAAAPSPRQGAPASEPDASEPDASTAASTLDIEAGRLAYEIPREMWLGEQETVEVHLGQLQAPGLTEGFSGRGDVRTEDIPVVETMSVALTCEPGAFDIAPRSPEAQLVKPDLIKGTPFHQVDFGRWIWRVTPRRRGDQTLLVKVSAAVRDSRGIEATASLPDRTIAVTVRVSLARATAGAIGRAVPALAGTVATTLIGIFTHDYWWPYVRDTVWPAFRALAGVP